MATISYTWYRSDASTGASPTSLASGTITGTTTKGYIPEIYNKFLFISGEVTTADSGYSTSNTSKSAYKQITKGIANLTADVNSSSLGRTIADKTATGKISSSSPNVTGIGNTAVNPTANATYTYQWYSASTSTGGGSAAISGATGSKWAVSAAMKTIADNSYYYKCVITPVLGETGQYTSGTMTSGSTAWTQLTPGKQYVSAVALNDVTAVGSEITATFTVSTTA